QRPQPARRRARKRQASVDRDNADLSRSSGCCRRIRPRRVDAWSIWDPFFAIAELKQKARALPLDRSVTTQNSFFLVNSGFAATPARVVATINGAVATTTWADQHRDQVAAILAEASGVDLAAEQRSVDRAGFTFGPLNNDVLAQHQGGG